MISSQFFKAKFLVICWLMLQSFVAYAGELPCGPELVRPTIYKRFPEYQHYRSVFREVSAEEAFQLVKHTLEPSLSAKDRLALLIAFLDREGSSYADAITQLKWFGVRYRLNPFERSLGIDVRFSRTLVLGRGIPKSDRELMNYMMSLAETLGLMPMDPQFLPRPWRNGLNTFQAPARFVNGAIAQLEKDSERIEQSYQLLRSIDPSFEYPWIEKAPSVLESRAIFAASYVLIPTVGLDFWVNHHLTQYWPFALALATYTGLYSPLRDKLVDVDGRVRTRFNIYWWTSHLARVTTLSLAAYFAYDYFVPEEPNPQTTSGGGVDHYFAQPNAGPAAAKGQDLSGPIAVERADIEELKKQIAQHPNQIDLTYLLSEKEETLRGLLSQQKKLEGK